ncbi:hypothetical protein KR49_03050 [Synechococcus sp. KORDI-49]|nr:hypothetical protein KR49_03050 [Synechococcus sp. KORDI-49]
MRLPQQVMALIMTLSVTIDLWLMLIVPVACMPVS